MTTEITTIVDAALVGRRLLEHPFYRRWEDGQLSHGELREYADQYRHFEASLPATLTDIATGLPEGPLRNAVEKNRADEVAAPSHLDLFEQFATHYGATGSAPSPAMSRLLGAYRECIDRGTSAAVAGLLAYEVQGAEIATTKATGLVEHYGAPRPATEFWRLHGEVEDDHATWIVDATDVVDVDDAIYGAHLVADAWWAFLDERALQAA